MLATAQRARDAMLDLGGEPTGRVTVGMPPRVALGLSVPLVRSFRERFPARRHHSAGRPEPVAARVAGRGASGSALLFDPLPSPQLTYEPLMREQLLLVARRRAICRRACP